MSSKLNKDVIIALDFPNGKIALDFLDLFKEEKPFVKIGMELYYGAGPEIVREIKSRGHKVFLDLKLHDIPNTVKSAIKVLTGLGVDMTNVHAGGCIKMMEAAKEGIAEALQEAGGNGPAEGPLLIAVTQLTSTSKEQMNNDLLIPGEVNEVVTKYAQNTKAAGLDGVVCSPLEAGMIHEACGSDFLTITPGVRFAGGDKGDQTRVTTPEKAAELGSDFIVVGRPITQAEDPVAAYRECVRQFLG